MNKQIMTTEEGWDCIPELNETVRSIEEIDSYIYEIKNCVRLSDLESMVSDMRRALVDALNTLDLIDTDCEYITEDELDLED